ncbi:MAG: DUF4230 domain-containing protein [Pyrinomonadaceae bacterium]|nr:DUF4230 domain-containing protein [Phycisphaerales bacterium]
MPWIDFTPIVLILSGLLLGGSLMWYIPRRSGKHSRDRRQWRTENVSTQMIAERVCSVGKLVALEVSAKEIATASAGWSWLPPLIFNQAKLAMIFHFEKQYSIDLASISADDIREIGPGKCRLRLPLIVGQLRLTNMTPYDIQSARVLGLLDLIPMTAERQKDLMERAQHQAAGLFEAWDARYLAEARVSAERQLRMLMDLLGTQVEFEWGAGVFQPEIVAPAKVTATVLQSPAPPQAIVEARATANPGRRLLIQRWLQEARVSA